MAVCKHCGKVFNWGNEDGRWVALVPTGEEEGLELTHQDEDGVLRATHRQVCTGVIGAVRVARLARPIPSTNVIRPASKEPPMPKPRARRKPKKESGLTVIELMILVAIIFIVATLIAGGIKGWKGYQDGNSTWGLNGVTEYRCIEGYKFVVGGGGQPRQIMDEFGRGVPCK